MHAVLGLCQLDPNFDILIIASKKERSLREISPLVLGSFLR